MFEGGSGMIIIINNKSDSFFRFICEFSGNTETYHISYVVS